MASKLIYAFVATSVAIVAPGTAAAAVVVNNYTVTSTGLGGPVPSVTLSFTLSYDNAIATSGATVSNFTSSSANASFNPVGGVGFNFFPSSNQFQIGGLLNDPGLTVVGTNDFFLGFTDNGSTIGSAILGYTATGQATNFSSFNTVVRRNIVGSVPEPGTWAMMLLGFGVIGGTMRKRLRKQTLAVA